MQAELKELSINSTSEASGIEPSDWLLEIKTQVEMHPAVNHLLLARLATGQYSALDYKVFSLQHFALVGQFTLYMELLLLGAPSSEHKLWLAKVLVDEYGEGSDGEDHATLYSHYLRNVGATDEEMYSTPLASAIWEFVGVHLRLCRSGSYAAGLGALGPGHEWAIPKMFHQIIPGLKKAGLGLKEREYFDLHTEQDIDHANWMTESLEKLGIEEEFRKEVLRGALISLGARFNFWTDLERCIVENRQPYSIETVSNGLLGKKTRKVYKRMGTLRDLDSAVQNFLSGKPWPHPLPSDEELIGVAK